MHNVNPVFAAILDAICPPPSPTNALSAIHAISLKLGFPAEDIVAIKPWTNAPLDKWEYQLKDTTEWIFINLSNS